MARRGCLRVLIADDDDDILRMIQVALMDEQYEFIVAHDGTEAVALARSQRPHLILMDIEMPRCDGFEACRTLRADAQLHDVPIIMLTSRTSEKDILRGFADGAYDYITKPFSLMHLRTRVKTWLLRAGHGENETAAQNDDAVPAAGDSAS